jgi:hypothetical protein
MDESHRDLRAVEDLVAPAHLFGGHAVLGSPTPVPARGGAFGCYIDAAPYLDVPLDRCSKVGSRSLVYVGISPQRPPANGRPPSRETLRTRVRYQYTGDAEGATFRLSLGCLLSHELGIELRRVGPSGSYTFAAGERLLSAWMREHVHVCWTEHDEPWLIKEHLLRAHDLPLNLDQNLDHPFHAKLTGLRHDARARARALPYA